jgi:hypothetical protein
MNIEFEQYSYRDLKGVNDPKTGISCAVKFEIDLNQLISFTTGLSYELRKNSYVTGMLYDTTSTIWIGGDLPPYKYASSQSYRFVGLPLGISLNYLKGTKLRIYQIFDIQLSYLLSADANGLSYYETGDIVSYKRNNAADRNGITASFSTSIGISRAINEKMAIKFEPGINYMINNCLKSTYAKQKFFDLKFDIGLVYNL